MKNDDLLNFPTNDVVLFRGVTFFKAQEDENNRVLLMVRVMCDCQKFLSDNKISILNK